jgi:hypothetical protein
MQQGFSGELSTSWKDEHALEIAAEGFISVSESDEERTEISI